MSHASVIVALSPEEIEHHGSIENAVSHQMEPFNENGRWFADGSRWDWWTIGGRYAAKFAEEGYSVETDPANLEHCQYCDGTGKRTDKPGVDFTWCGGCNACHGRGQKLKWPTQWRDVGNVAKRGDIDRLEGTLTAFAFLKDRRWCESGRLGFFGTTTVTECEIKAAKAGADFEGRCVHVCEKTKAKIVSFQESGDAQWDELFWPRFIRNLPVLVTVDYHV